MKCWCDGVEFYKCSDCEKVPAWNRLNKLDKLNLITYSRKLKRGEEDFELLKKILKAELCISMIPKNANI